MNQKTVAGLLAERRLRKLSRPPFDQVDRLLAAALKDAGNVRRILEIDEARAFDAAYDIAFKTALALMRAHGYRPTESFQHRTAIEFCRAVLDASWRTTLELLDDMRRRRNRLMYEGDMVVGRGEAERAIEEAERFHGALVRLIAGLRRRRDPSP